MSIRSKYWAMVPAAGIGSRMQSEMPKQYLKIRGKCILEYTLERFCSYPDIQGVVVALAAEDPYWSNLKIASHEKLILVTGGKERCHSVLNGLRSIEKLAEANDWVMVHDAARPCLLADDIDKLIQETNKGASGVILATPVRDTMKRAYHSNIVKETVEREYLWHALTPQMFRLSELISALENALEQSLLVTDEAQAMEFCSKPPILVEGHVDNIKVTHPRDLLLAETILSHQENS